MPNDDTKSLWVRLSEGDYACELKLSPKRKTLSLEVSAGKVVVRAPNFADRRQVQAFVQSRAGWLQEKLRQQQQRQAEIPRRSYTSGTTLPFLGREYRLDIASAHTNGVSLQSDRLQVCHGPRGNAEKLIKSWYREQARGLLTDKSLACARQLNVSVAEITLRQTKTKWGHCTRSGRIQYNWLIMLAPESIVDYLVAHEVSHRVHLNHSAAFWQTVASICPDYRQRRQWLQRYGHTLIL